MKNVYKQKRQQGFTIIEVLIVLAIAAVILLIVFLAVPALQRNSRNNSIRNDAASVLAGVNDFISNNNGNLPTGPASTTGPTITITGAAGTNNTEAKVRGGTVVQIATGGCGGAAPALGTIDVHTGCKCNTAGTGTAAAARAISALFTTETTSSATAAQCIES